MRVSVILGSLACCLSAVALRGGDTIENRYVIEFDARKAPLDSLGKREELHTHFYNHLAARDVGYEVHHEYKMSWYSGASVTIRDPAHLEHLEGFPMVERIWPVTYVEPPEPVSRDVLDGFTRRTASEPALFPEERSESAGESTPHLEARQARFPNAYGTEGDFGPLSQIPAIQAADIRNSVGKGSGVIIGVVDTGVDYNRPEMGGGMGPNFKITGGVNYLVPEGSTGTVTDERGNVQTRNDPMDTCRGHGTFVGHMAAAVSGAAGNPYMIPGIASDAKMRHYKIFSCDTGTSDDTILAAVTQAVQDGCKVINLSLGSASGWTLGQGNVNIAKVAAQGVHLVVAAGNEGASGIFYSSNPAGGGSLVVGASKGATEPYVEGQLQNGNTNSGSPIRFGLDSGVYNGKYKVYAISGDVCNGIPGVSAPFNVADRVLVFAARGSCKDKAAAKQVAAQNAAGLVLYSADNAPERRATPLTYGSLATPSDSTIILNLYNANPSNTFITFPNAGVSPKFDPIPVYGRPTSFTTRGPTFDLSVLPHVTAPGDNLIASYPAVLGGYSVGQGTSYAAPIAAGAVAIMVQKTPSISPTEVRERFQMTAKTFQPLAGGRLADSVAVQGAGQIQLADAINTNTYISPTMITFNDTKYTQATKFVVITNNANSQITYTLGHTPASTMYTYRNGQADPNPEYLDDVSVTKNFATIKFSRTAITLGAGQRAMVLYRVTPPSGLTASRLPVYSGFITVTGGSVPLHQSYIGVAANMIDIPAISPILAPQLVNPQGAKVTSGTYTYRIINGDRVEWVGDAPKIQFKLLTGSPKVNIDVLPEASTFTATYSKRSEEEARNVSELDKYFPKRIAGTSVTASTLSNAKENICSYDPPPGCSTNKPVSPDDTYSQTQVAGMGNVYRYVPRNSGNEEGDGTDKTTVDVYVPISPTTKDAVVTGNYKVLLRVLKVTGNPIVANDYDSYLSPSIRIVRAAS